MKGERFIAPAVLLGAWQILAGLDWVPGYLIPSPWKILLGLRDLFVVGMPPEHRLPVHVLHSLYRVFAGFAAACAMGVPLGLLMGWSKRLRTLLNPLVEIFRPIPPLAWIPIAILWFGIGLKSAAFIIFLGAFFPILLNTVSGVLNINPIFFEAARTLGARRSDMFFKVVLPGATPSIFLGMRVGVGIGWMTLVAAEFTGVRQGYGLGYMIMTARDVQRPDEIIAGMLVIGLIGLCINSLLRFWEERILPWR